MINIGIVGYGYWGPNLVRNFAGAADAQVRAVSDLDEQRLGLVKKRFPAVEVTTDCHSLFARPDIDAVAIATPVSSHFKLALAALRCGQARLYREATYRDRGAGGAVDRRGRQARTRPACGPYLHLHRRRAQDAGPGGGR